MPDPARDALRATFGFPDFRTGQEAVVSRLLAGRSTLAIFPTGGGKSICYQLPALLLDGLTVVVSPLIALMKDQLDFLKRHNVPAARLDSSLSLDEARAVFDALRNNQLKLLYLSPERLSTERTRQQLARHTISLLAVDESHCISEWGHNFRPDYLKLAGLAKELKVGRVLALTATATPPVAADIARGFGIAEDDIVSTGFGRPNLTLGVTPTTPAQRDRLLLDRLKQTDGAAIVYVTLQHTAETVAANLARAGLPAKPYHAGLDAEVRTVTQDWFMAAPRAIVVATIAFGMGIDKADIRAVLHYNVPKSLENYAQETGRAGRDGLPARCELYACAADRTTLENFTYGDTPTTEAIAGLVRHLAAQPAEFDVSTYELSGEFDTRPLVVETLLTYLELDGVIAATNPFYTEYQLQWQQNAAAVFARFDPARAEFLKRVFAAAKQGRTWVTLDTAAVAKQLGEERSRIVAALTYLEQQGDLMLKPAGARQGYRKTGGSVKVSKLTERFAERERRDIERLNSVLDYAVSPGCFWQRLQSYFGETAGDCGHCGWCNGERPGPLPTETPPTLGPKERELLAAVQRERKPELALPRQMARFLCGLNSPATVRAKLTRHSAFGALQHFPFAAVLAFVSAPPGAAP